MANSLIYIILFLLITPLELSIAKKCFFTPKYEIHVINNLPSYSPQLKIHCQSGDDDFGEYFPLLNEDVNWSFCGDLFGRSLYFCHFWWDEKNKVFDVFNDIETCVKDGQVPYFSRECIWIVKSDGFYLGHYNDNGNINMYRYTEWS